MPNLSLNGVVNNPDRVVAPTKVNGGKSILIVLADGPSPIIKSNWKSSMAGYNISSMFGERRWISSINNTSLGCRLVNKAAKSPALFIIGPEVDLKPTPNSYDMIWASVVCRAQEGQIIMYDPLPLL